MDIKEKIISQSLLLFINRGVRSVNMDEVSSNLGISKKTLYLYVNNKSDLVFQAFSLQCENLTASLSSIYNKDKNAIDELYEIDEVIIHLFKSMHVSLISELKKHYLESWEVIENFKTNFLFNLIETNIKKGIRQNLYRQNLNPNIISKIFINRSESLVDGQLYSDKNIDLRDILKEHRVYHVRGIASLKGTQHLEEKLEIW
jgi:TetR/AcrR family transcriptional regulator, cholesterol catabolism regulator